MQVKNVNAWLAELWGMCEGEFQYCRGAKVLDFAEKLLLRDANMTYGGVDDMKRLACLNEPAVPHILKKLYALHEICNIFNDLHDNKEDGPHIDDKKQKKRSKNRSTKNVVLDDDDCKLIEENNLAFCRPTSESLLASSNRNGGKRGITRPLSCICVLRESWSQKEMLLFVASLLQENFTREGDTGRKLLEESDLKPRSDFLELNIALSLQQQNRMKQMGTKVRNASSYMEKLKDDVKKGKESSSSNGILDPFPKSTEFNADDYAILVAGPTPFRKFPEPFLCLIGTSRSYTLDKDTYPTFLHDDRTRGCLPTCIVQLVADPTKVKVGEQEHVKGEARLLDSIVRRVVPLLPVSLARTESKLEASVESLFDESGTADQGDSAVGSGQKAETKMATGVRIVADENVVTEMPKRLRKKSEAATSGESPSVLRVLLVRNMLNVEADVTAMTTLPMVTSLMYATAEHESGLLTNSIIGLNYRTLGPSERFTISSDSSHHSSTNAAEAGIDSFVRFVTPPLVMTEAVTTTNVAGIPFATALEINTKNVSNDTLLDDHDVSWEFIDQLAPPVLFAQIHEIDYHHLSTEFNVGTSHQVCLNAEARMQTEYYLSESRRRKIRPRKPSISMLRFPPLKPRSRCMLVHALEATCSGLRERLSGYENLTDRLEEFQDAQVKVVNDKVGKLDAELAEMACYLEEKFYPHLLTTISGRSRAIEKGMQDGLAARIDHGREGRSLRNIAAYNPSVKADFNSAVQELHKIDFPLLAELKSHKDASVEDIINLLRLEGPLADAPGMGDLQPNIEQLKIPIHRSEDQNLIGEASTPPPQRPCCHCHYNDPIHNLCLCKLHPPIGVDDYKIVHADMDTTQESSQENVQGDAATVKFKKEDLNTTLERNLLS
uniref:Putative glutamine amidotransferase PB2B2.05 n=1 Tax=Tanacetum cinerariifolium TaxID=118510 RepID=A0A6L2LBH7_TANCI|nr:putative glutamine amidotransferase PB2B2.05 [Tanacetum cinerariifolium]